MPADLHRPEIFEQEGWHYELPDGEFLFAYDRQAWQLEIAVQAPVRSEPVQIRYELSPNEPTEGKTRLAWGYVLDRDSGRMERIAMQALADAVCAATKCC